jgi:hypothetical protein
MNCKRALTPLLVSAVLFLSTCSVLVESASNETWIVYDLVYPGLRLRIEAPRQAYPGENITVTVKAEAPGGKIYVEHIYIKIYGLRNETEKISLKNLTYLKDTFLTIPHVVDYVVEISNDTSPGLTYGIIECRWESENMPLFLPPAGFILTYVKGMELEQLKEAYDSLLGNYTELDSKYSSEVGGTRNLMYVFVGTTVVAGITVLLLVLRRPKTFS